MSALFNDVHSPTPAPAVDVKLIDLVGTDLVDTFMNHLRPEEATPEQREAARDAACYGLEWDVLGLHPAEEPQYTECGQVIPAHALQG